MRNRDYPILEYDDSREALIDPVRVYKRADIAEVCILCFFKDVIEAVTHDYDTRIVCELPCECGPHLVRELTTDGVRIAYAHPGVGGPHAVGMLEALGATGCNTFIVIGGAGVLKLDIACGHIVIPTAAVRDEGTSYHYLLPGREVAPTVEVVDVLKHILVRHRVPYLEGKNWTTDGFFRETKAKVARRRDEGCLTVDMEAASMYAAAQYREYRIGQLLYGGDDVSAEEWDNRSWTSRADVRENLFALAIEAAKELTNNKQ